MGAKSLDLNNAAKEELRAQLAAAMAADNEEEAVKAMTAFAEHIQQSILDEARVASNIIGYDWTGSAGECYRNFKEAFNNAIRGDSNYSDRAAQEQVDRLKRYETMTAEQIDKMKETATRKLGELKSIYLSAQESGEYDTSLMPEWLKINIEQSGQQAGTYIETQIGEVERLISELTTARTTAIEISADETANAVTDAGETVAEAANNEQEKVLTKAELLKQALSELENSYAIHDVSEKDYWRKRKEYIEQYRDEESAEWYKLYDEVTEHYEKLSETERKEQEKAVKEKTDSAKERFDALYDELKNEEITREAFNKRYIELTEELAQQRIDISEYASDKIADYDRKIAEENISVWEKSSEEITSKITKAYEDVSKAYESARDKYIDSVGLIDEKITDNSGAQRYILSDFKAQTKALEKYRSDMEKLRKTGISDSMTEQIMSLSYDSGERQGFITELLRMSDSQREKYYRDYEEYIAQAEKTAKGEVSDRLNEADELAKRVYPIYTALFPRRHMRRE